MASAAASWSNTPPCLLWEIIKHLPIADYIRFGAVCVSWRMVLAEKRMPPTPRLWMVLHPSEGRLRFLSLHDQKEYHLQLPEILGCSNPYIKSSINGWLRLQSSDVHDQVPPSHVLMFNPITQVTAHLPSFDTIPNIAGNEESFHKSIKVLALSFQLTDSISSTVAAIATSFCSNTLAFAKQGDESWKNIGNLYVEDDDFVGNILEDDGFFVDHIIYREQLYATLSSGYLIVFNFSEFSQGGVTFEYKLSPHLGIYYTHHLVELSGDLLLILRNMKYKRRMGKRFHWTTDIKVFKINSISEWVELKDLGGHVILLSFDHSCEAISVSVEEFKELKGNCIYFVDGLNEFCWKLRAYNVADQSFFKPPWRFTRNSFPPVWFTPNMSSC